MLGVQSRCGERWLRLPAVPPPVEALRPVNCTASATRHLPEQARRSVSHFACHKHCHYLNPSAVAQSAPDLQSLSRFDATRHVAGCVHAEAGGGGLLGRAALQRGCDECWFSAQRDLAAWLPPSSRPAFPARTLCPTVEPHSVVSPAPPAWALLLQVPRNHLDLRHRLDKDGKRYGKLIEYK